MTGRPRGSHSASERVEMRFTPAELAALDKARGGQSRTAYIKARLKEDPVSKPVKAQPPARPLVVDATHRHRAKADGQTKMEHFTLLRHFVCEVPGCTAIDRWDH